MDRFRAFLADLRRDAGRQLPMAAMLVISGALLEGIGILAILPFAALITGNTDTEAARIMLEWMGAMGLFSQGARASALAVGFLLVLALRAIVIWQRDTRLLVLGLGYVDRWRSKLFRAISGADWITVSAFRRTDIEHAITNDVNRLASGTDQLLRTGASVALAIVQLALIATLSPLLLVLVFVLLVITLTSTLPLLRRANLLGERTTHSGRRIHRVLGDFLASQKLARLNNAEAEFLTRFDGAVSTVRTNILAFQKSQLTARLWFQFAAGAVVMAALLFGVFVLKTPLSVLALTLLVLARLVGPIQMIAGTGQAIANALPAFESLVHLEADLRGSAEPIAETTVTVKRAAGPASLSLRRASFTYPGQQAPVFQNINLDIKAGEIVALNGKSGAGKTTLLDVVCGLLHSETGELLIDGQSISDQSATRHWRSQLAYLPQDPFLFDASIRENLLWGAQSPDDGKIWQALELAGAADFVRAATDGLYSRVGDRGQSLSGGERQRICIARALLRQPRLMILDEATSAIDAVLEEDILSRLEAMRAKFSILYVTHRLDALKHADRILTLDGGAVSETWAAN